MRIIITLSALIMLSGSARAWDISGGNQATIWASQADSTNAYNVLHYKEDCDLRLSGSLKDDIKVEAGLKFLYDQERWDDQPVFSGISKRYLQLRTEDLSARAGTYYATLGRGLVLNCANEQAAKIDRYLDGALVSASLEDLGDARLLFGRIRENTVELDTSKTYFGTEIKMTRFAFITPGLTYLRANAAGPALDPSFGKPADEQYSGILGGTFGPVDLYGEYAGRRTYGRLSPSAGWVGIEDVNGHAFYGSLTAAYTGLGVAMDFKKYQDFDAAINAPPSCNREGRLLNNGQDEYGFQADLTATPWMAWEFRGNYSWARTGEARGELITSDGQVYPGTQKWQDVFVEGRWEAREDIILNAEGRQRQEDNLQPDIIRKEYMGASAGVVWKYEGSRTLSVKAGGNRYRNIYDVEKLYYDEVLAELGWVPLGWLNVFATADLADKPIAEYDDQKSWGEAGCTIDFDQGRQQLKVSAGRTKGGLVCSGGFCRWEPAFKGFKAVWNWKF
ncbi:MAG: DUF6029 family protein [Candidatus Edwardsbacteria bacterium]|nr:DUF6029 family protein [Candidatus Edwardsbacteria bacterium]